MNDTATRTHTDPIRWGILGAGRIATAQTQDLLDNGFTVQAVGSRSLDSSRAFSARFGIPDAHGSYDALVANPDVDVVYVATPHSFHHAHALLAINAGKHVLVEKPFTINAHQAQEVVTLAEKNGLVVLEAMWTRFLPHMVRVREIIKDGLLGEIRKITASHNRNLSKDPTHRLNNPALGGGALLDLGVYPVSFAFDVLGAPQQIRASAIKTTTGVDRQTAVILTYADGQQALLDCALDAAGSSRATIIGTEGWINIESVWNQSATFGRYDHQGHMVEIFAQPAKGRGMQFQALEMESLIKNSPSARRILPPHDSVAIIAAMDTIRQQIGLVYDADHPA
ncbi:Gfo/Idh/MocA family oxidoreductase (plasmid) [Paenarthrobacter sp. OM7]|uniref:Gfo/Idh/MocA family protein n=1 Tax=Paenarthrobacter sp. OM7 TaxID=3041264 RepID=UPI0024699C8E|nr:Gfo/Idh/MocA family oxidoreductase [Paenarthrobacter sp. OM7]WGM22858.1 Gfo/Idh/MocA family oxidoreductase [Paenarthrobacter sp. OM7]